jgi:cell division protein FtsA
MDMSQNGVEMSNKTLLKIIPQSYSIDLEDGIKNPVGMHGKKLEVHSHIFSINSSTISNVRKGIMDIGVSVLDVFPNVLSASEATLSRRQRELGVVCIDMGSSTTNIAVYEE